MKQETYIPQNDVYVLLRANGSIAHSADTLTNLFNSSQYAHAIQLHGSAANLRALGWSIKRAKLEFVNKPVVAAEVGDDVRGAAALAGYNPTSDYLVGTPSWDSASFELRGRFLKIMESVQYSQEETCNAWSWFILGRRT